jgi:hypothetical protein
VTDGLEAALEQGQGRRRRQGRRDLGRREHRSAIPEGQPSRRVQIHLIPVLLGEGVRLFVDLDNEPVELRPNRVIETSARRTFGSTSGNDTPLPRAGSIDDRDRLDLDQVLGLSQRLHPHDGVGRLVVAEHRNLRRPRGRQLAKLRTRVFAVYGRCCRDCGRSDVPLEVHHVNGDPTDNRIANTIPLCRDCHRSSEMHR